MSGTFTIQPLFPDSVVTECSLVADAVCNLYPGEMASMQNAVQKRRQEFGAGRGCARTALARLGFADVAIEKQKDGSPLWPEGAVGSISHSSLWSGAAVARKDQIRGIGLDIETVDRVGQRLERMILTLDEAAWMTRQPRGLWRQWRATIFSAKEAIYKCLHPLYAERIGFMDAIVTPSQDDLTFSVTMIGAVADAIPGCTVMQGRYLMHEGNVFTGIVLQA